MSARQDASDQDSSIRVLVIDDEAKIRQVVCSALAGEHVTCTQAADGAQGLALAAAERPDLIVLDLGLPDQDGIDVCREIRRWSQAPIVVLSARHSEQEKEALLDAGADDYVTKPFGVEELLARIRVALRRVDATPQASEPIVRGGLVIDRERFRVVRDGEEVRLTPKEFELLMYFAQHPGRVLTHRAILKAIWGARAIDQPEHLRVLIGSLRKKIEIDPSRPRYILTEPWVGYRFADVDATG